MKITKRGHACLEISNQNRTLLIDPGSYTDDLGTPNNLDAIVITHAHDDHCFEPQLQRLLAANPKCEILGPTEVINRLSAATQPEIVAAVKHQVFHGDHYKIAEFELDFMGDLHQVIHASLPQLPNTGVLVNRTLYYPGDSYTVCDLPYQVLACPSSAPWLSIGDVIDFLDAMRPARCFATHNALLSERGHALQNSRIREVTERHGGEFRYLDLGESWDV
jgi:L-ascorbate metabolism protein UlaG (beta-lactamase superfamily)